MGGLARWNRFSRFKMLRFKTLNIGPVRWCRLRSINLFWRSFGLLLALMCVGFALWSYGVTMRQEYSRAQALAGQLTTAVNLTRSAIMHAKATNRASLLLELNADERVDVFVREADDVLVPLGDTAMSHWLLNMLQTRLGKTTQLAAEVNQIEGLWISFDMGGSTLGLHSYWLRVDADRIEARLKNPTWWWLWLTLAVVIAAFGAAWLTQRITDPLSTLAQRIQDLSEGVPYAPLPPHSVKEISKVNAGMNRMAQTLAHQEADRRFMLAGLSHDLRTPLARLRLELEFAPLSPSQRTAMNSDIMQIDTQLKQFTDYIGSDQAQLKRLDLGELMRAVLARYERDTRCVLTLNITPNLPIHGDESMLLRLVGNLIENACRYGVQHTPCQDLLAASQYVVTAVVDTQVANKWAADESVTDQLIPLSAPVPVAITVQASRQKHTVMLSIKDHGQGVSSEQLAHLIQPFVRGDSSRNGCDGSGLGLAIVARIAKRHCAELTLHSDVGVGFEARLVFPIAV
jgi:two-component system, OmpR family, osmolarity sensor histidine kinase EnvZ